MREMPARYGKIPQKNRPKISGLRKMKIKK
jgi:hypothetical protein